MGGAGSDVTTDGVRSVPGAAAQGGKSSSLFAAVLFEWKGFCMGGAAIKGEFTGWKEEALFSDWTTGVLGVSKTIPAGRYKYHYVIDGKVSILYYILYTLYGIPYTIHHTPYTIHHLPYTAR